MFQVHYFSLDVEEAELDVLKTIPWDKVDINREIKNSIMYFFRVLTIEYTHTDRRGVKELMLKNSYTHLYNVGEDMVFVKNGFIL